jgi:hypothetical protein
VQIPAGRALNKLKQAEMVAERSPAVALKAAVVVDAAVSLADV